MVWPTLGSRRAKEQNRTEQNMTKSAKEGGGGDTHTDHARCVCVCVCVCVCSRMAHTEASEHLWSDSVGRRDELWPGEQVHAVVVGSLVLLTFVLAVHLHLRLNTHDTPQLHTTQFTVVAKVI